MQNFNPSLYDVLGRIPKHATAKEIKTAYRILALHHHPDKNPHDRIMAEEKMKELNEAYQILSNPQKREAYNEKLRQHDETLRKQEEERKRKEAAERRKKQMEEDAKQRLKMNFNFQQEKNMQRTREKNTNDTGTLVGVGLALAGLALLIASLSDND